MACLQRKRTKMQCREADAPEELFSLTGAVKGPEKEPFRNDSNCIPQLAITDVQEHFRRHEIDAFHLFLFTIALTCPPPPKTRSLFTQVATNAPNVTRYH